MHSENRQRRSTQNNTTSANSVFDGEQNLQIVGSTDTEVTFTDHGAVEQAFDSFDRALGSVDSTVASAFSNTRDVLGDQVSAIKELATQLKVGDIEGSKWIAFSIVAAVIIGIFSYAAVNIWG